MAVEEEQGVERGSDPAEAVEAQAEETEPTVEADDVEAHVWRAQT
jgi:hypothetical protein